MHGYLGCLAGDPRIDLVDVREDAEHDLAGMLGDPRVDVALTHETVERRHRGRCVELGFEEGEEREPSGLEPGAGLTRPP